MKRLTAVLAVMFFVFSAASSHAGALKKVWSVGSDNKGYVEFSSLPASQVMNTYKQKFKAGEFRIRAGKKVDKGGFPGVQPGPMDGWGDFKEWPVRIQFKVETPAPGGYILSIGTLGYSRETDAVLNISIGDYEVTSIVAPGLGDEFLYISTGAGEPRTLFFNIPADQVKTGVNELTLTIERGTYIVYDYIRLDAVTETGRPAVKNFEVDSPRFLVRLGEGAGHLVRGRFFSAGGAAKATARVRIGGAEYSAETEIWNGYNEPGVIIPELKEQADAEFTLEIDGEIIGSGTTTVRPIRHYEITLVPHSHLDIGYPDLQPNVMLGQDHYLQRAADLIEDSPGEPMTWISEVSWPVRNVFNGVGAYSLYGPWIDEVPLMRTVSKEFLRDTSSMRNVAPLAKLTTSSKETGGMNLLRLVDGSNLGWMTGSPAAQTWVGMEFETTRKLSYVAVRGGKNSDNQILKVRLTLESDSETTVLEDGPMGATRERLLFELGEIPAKNLKMEFLDAAKPGEPGEIMEIEVWEKTPHDVLKGRLVDAIRAGRLEVTGLYLNFLTQLIPTEWFVRSMLHSKEVADRAGVELTTALITDVPGYSFLVPDLLAGSNIKYFYAALNPYHAKTCQYNMPRAFYWDGPAGGRVLVYHTFDSYNEAWRMGFTRGLDLAQGKVEEFIDRLESESYPYDEIILRTLGDITDDGPVPELLSGVVRDWNETWAYPHIKIGTPAEFFPSFEKNNASAFPVLKGDWTGYWEDGAASTAKETTVIRSVHRDLQAAGAFAAVKQILSGDEPELREELRAAEENLYLYDEHTWGADESVRKPDTQRTFGQWHLKGMPAWDAADRIERAFDMLRPLAQQFAPAPRHGGTIRAVVNPLGNPRSGYVTAPAPKDSTGAAVYDASTDKEIASSLISDSDKTRLMFRAENVPPMGFSYYEITGNSGAPETAAPVNPLRIENQFYSVSVDGGTGRITGIFDKELVAELVDTTGGFGMNEFLFVEGYANDNPARLSEVKIRPGDASPLFSEIVIEGTAPFVPKIVQKVRLYNDTKLIEFVNDIDKTLTYDKESAYFAFPMNVPGGELRVEATGGVLAFEKDQLPGASRDYISIQDGAAAVGPDYSVLLSMPDAPIVSPLGIRVLSFQKKLEMVNNSLFSYVFTNYWTTNYKAGQGGEFTFRYALTSVPGRAADSQITRFGFEYADSMRAMRVDPGRADGKPVSFLGIEADGVRLLGVKTAHDGNGVIVRVQEMNGRKADVSLNVNPALGFNGAELTNLLEQKTGDASISGGVVIFSVPPHAMQTIRLW